MTGNKVVNLLVSDTLLRVSMLCYCCVSTRDYINAIRSDDEIASSHARIGRASRDHRSVL